MQWTMYNMATTLGIFCYRWLFVITIYWPGYFFLFLPLYILVNPRRAGFIFNTLGPRKDGRHFCKLHFKCIFVKLHGSVFLWVQLQYPSVGSGNGFAPIRRQAIIYTNDGLVYWSIYVSLGLSELRKVTTYAHLQPFSSTEEAKLVEALSRKKTRTGLSAVDISFAANTLAAKGAGASAIMA